jgi:uncharacterized protein DUF4233
MMEAPTESPNPRTVKAVRGVFAATLTLEALTVLFVPRAVAQSGSGLTTTKLVILIVLAVLLIVAAGLQRRQVGLVLGTVLQVGLIACGVMTGAMYVLGIIFTAIWLYELHIRRQLLSPAPPEG